MNKLLTRLIHTRAFGVGVGVLCAIAAVLYWAGGFGAVLTGNTGVALPSANTWISSPVADLCAGLAASGATVLIMLLLSKLYNVMRSMTSLYMALFAVMQLATPDLMTQFYTGSVLSVTAPLCLALLFSCYRTPAATRHVFIIFLLLSFFSATQPCFAMYLPVFLLGLAQMRIFNGPSLTAAFLGVLTPWWIMLGFGIVSPGDIHLPHTASIFSEIDLEDTYLLLITTGITTFAMLVCYVLNLLKTIAYNARARAINGAFTVLALASVAAMCIDYRNIVAYVPLLNFSAAMEITHYFSTHRAEKSFIAIFILIAVYAAIFVCQILT
ncbi:MAG: hypothetical protein NC418_01680 [Muribaculaceae bacterium]|nr:hypothetical protein [Muribaculaceae bacterium]